MTPLIFVIIYFIMGILTAFIIRLTTGQDEDEDITYLGIAITWPVLVLLGSVYGLEKGIAILVNKTAEYIETHKK